MLKYIFITKTNIFYFVFEYSQNFNVYHDKLCTKNGKNNAINIVCMSCFTIISKAKMNFLNILKMFLAFEANSATSSNCTFLWISVHYVLIPN